LAKQGILDLDIRTPHMNDNQGSIKKEIRQGVLLISPKGNMLSENGHAYAMELLNKEMETGAPKILFNLSDVKVVNSTGLALLLIAASKTKEAKGKMALCCLPDPLKKLLVMMKLESNFSVFAEEGNALAFLKG
jgi:anti-sigma B factor antagonist